MKTLIGHEINEFCNSQDDDPVWKPNDETTPLQIINKAARKMNHVAIQETRKVKLGNSQTPVRCKGSISAEHSNHGQLGELDESGGIYNSGNGIWQGSALTLQITELTFFINNAPSCRLSCSRRIRGYHGKFFSSVYNISSSTPGIETWRRMKKVLPNENVNWNSLITSRNDAHTHEAEVATYQNGSIRGSLKSIMKPATARNKEDKRCTFKSPCGYEKPARNR